MTGRGPEIPDPPEADRRALEDQRDFLLRSIADLDSELAAGELEEATHAQLRDDYTRRAAPVLVALEALGPERQAMPEPPGEGNRGPASAGQRRPSGRRRLVAVVGVTLVLVGTIAAGLSSSLRPRDPGGTSTGNSQLGASPTATPVTELAERVRQNPEDAELRLAYARALLAEGEPVAALGEFDRVAELDPDNAEALAYGGWIVFLAARSSKEDPAELVGGAMRRLDAAIAAEPGFPDARFFRGMVLLEGRGDPAGAVTELEAYLKAAPDSPLAPRVQGVLDEARRRAAEGGPGPPPSSPPPG